MTQEAATTTVEATRGGDSVLLEIRDGVALVTLNRPDRLNALTSEMERRYYSILRQAGEDPAVRAIVVTGAGRGFCAGFDVDDLAVIAGSGQVPDDEPVSHILPLSMPKPLIAAVNGACAGLGLVLALMCDVRFAADGAKFTTAFVRRGLIAEHGISWVLPRLVGPSRALDLLLSGRVVLAEEAEAMGLVNAAVSPEDLLKSALDYARDLAVNCSPASMATIKRQVYSHLDKGIEDAVAESDRLMLESFQRPDMAEGVRSYQERRPPRFDAL